MNKQPHKRPTIAGLNEIDFTTSEEDQPATDFAGFRKLPVTWIMQPVIAFTKPTPQGAAMSRQSKK